MLTMAVAAVAGVGASLLVPLLTMSVINGPIAHHHSAGLLPLALLATAFGVLQAVLMFARRWVQATAVLGLETAVRNDLYAHLQRLHVGFHDRWQSGQLLSRVTVDLSTIRRFIGFGLIYLVVNSLQIAAVVVLLIHLDPGLGLLVAASTVPVVLLSHRFERTYIRLSRQLQDQEGDLTTVVEESAEGIRVIKAFGRRRLVDERFDGVARDLRTTAMAKVRLSANFWTVLELVPNLVIVVVLLVGALAVGEHSLTLGGLVAFFTLFIQVQWPVQSLGYILASGQEALTAADRIQEVFRAVPEIVGGDQDLRDPVGRLAFEGVGFRYPGSDLDVLHDVWLTVDPGETLALVGPTGCGKTTLTQLVCRLQDVTAGQITLDGVDVRRLSLESLRRTVQMAFEDPLLFSASVRDNITLGWPEADDQAIAHACQLAQVDFVAELPFGLDTRIGEQGQSLSGGQRQRLALARAVLGDAPVLVLDDTLSALDVHTEARVEAGLRRALAGRTALVVAHRPSTVALADRVALLEGGTITHVGTHQELLAQVPSYRAILSQAADSDLSESGQAAS
ncbi:MAG TPA: ABC transporter ATP-binding protein [Verrucomicrobiae bacterium]|nr:ABC transporter ATP-binding protein [Verrucomicrobiae bacterium]